MIYKVNMHLGEGLGEGKDETSPMVRTFMANINER